MMKAPGAIGADEACVSFAAVEGEAARAMTAPQDELFREAVALAPATVLRSLANAADPDERPEVSVYMSSGQSLAGELVRIGADLRQDVLVLADPDTGRLGYVLLAHVVAVEVRGAQRHRDVLSGGRLARLAVGPPVSPLALRREFAATPDFPLEVAWNAVPDAEPALANLEKLLRGLRDLVGDVRADEMGRLAWAQIPTVRVGHRAGAALSVDRVPDGLAVHVDLVAALPRDLTGELRGQLNAAL